MSKKRLLVIEDDTDVAEMLVVYFSSQGYDVFNAMTGIDGIAVARSKFPNLILLDVMLPDMDGFDVCKSLRTTTLTKHIPTIFLTQRDGRADKVRGLELGADDYVTKPFDMEELRLRVQGSIRRASREMLHDPHTGLPTGPMIEEIREKFLGKPGCSPLVIDLVGFKGFRDVYGFVAADEALAFVGQVFSETIAKAGTAEDFAGAFSEERYLVFTFSVEPAAFIEALIARFSVGVKRFYNFLDSERGYVVLHEGQDEEQHVPLMHFTVSRPVEERTL